MLPQIILLGGNVAPFLPLFAPMSLTSSDVSSYVGGGRWIPAVYWNLCYFGSKSL